MDTIQIVAMAITLAIMIPMPVLFYLEYKKDYNIFENLFIIIMAVMYVLLSLALTAFLLAVVYYVILLFSKVKDDDIKTVIATESPCVVNLVKNNLEKGKDVNNLHLLNIQDSCRKLEFFKDIKNNKLIKKEPLRLFF